MLGSICMRGAMQEGSGKQGALRARMKRYVIV